MSKRKPDLLRLPIMPGGEMMKVQGIEVYVCESCLSGDHLSYGSDHRQGEKGRSIDRACRLWQGIWQQWKHQLVWEK